MTPEEHLFAAILANAYDNAARLIYSDWLEERGDARGEYLRIEVELSSLPRHHEKRRELVQSLNRLSDSFDREWVLRISRAIDVFVEAIDPERKFSLIRVIREATGMDLVETLRLLNQGGARRVARVSTLDEANRILKMLEQAGATVGLYPAGQEFDL